MATVAEEITALAEQTVLAADDLLVSVDVSDTSMAAAGTTKKLPHGTFLNQRVSVVDITDGETVVGYARLIAANDVAGVAITIIADGTGDVTTILAGTVIVKTSDGNEDGGPLYVKNNDSWVLYDDGTDVLTLAVSAAGAATLQRTAGSTLTFDVVLQIIWI